MPVEYRELVAADFDQASELQRRVFGLSDLDLISPLMLNLVARNRPPMGLHLGAFVTEDSGTRLVGAVFSFATFVPQSSYTSMLAVLPEYQEGMFGFKLLAEYRNVAMARGLETMFGVYDPLNLALARLYAGGVGFVGTELLGDKLLFRWDFRSEHTVAKLNRDKPSRDPLVPGTSPVARSDFLPDEPEVLFALSGDGEEQRAEARVVLGEYLNQRGYQITDCLTVRIEGERKSYYVLRLVR